MKLPNPKSMLKSARDKIHSETSALVKEVSPTIQEETRKIVDAGADQLAKKVVAVSVILVIGFIAVRAIGGARVPKLPSRNYYMPHYEVNYTINIH